MIPMGGYKGQHRKASVANRKAIWMLVVILRGQKGRVSMKPELGE